MQILIPFQPNVVILDPLYNSMAGALSDEVVVRQFLTNMRVLRDKLGCALIMVLHTKKSMYSQKGHKFNLGKDALFGSTFFEANVDHMFMLEKVEYTNMVNVTCTTQRSGRIVKKLVIELVEPVPLYFREVKDRNLGQLKETALKVIKVLREHGDLTGQNIMKKLKIGRSCFYEAIKIPLKAGSIAKDSSRPVKYSLRENES